MSRRLLALLTGAAVFVLWLCLTFTHPLTHWPGWLGDSRFNLYILEHGYRFFTGQDASFWNAPIFYPAPLTTAFSDAHLGTLPLYSVWRVLGFDREHAGAYWLYACFALDFAAGYWGLRRFRFSRAGALLGAYFFAFGLPVLAQLFHSQLIPRFWVPVAFVAFAHYLETGRFRALAATALAVVLQLYATIYIGYFLILGLLAYFIAGRIVGAPDQPLRFRPLCLVGAISILALLPLALPYAKVSAWRGERSFKEIYAQIPRLSSYFQAPSWSVPWGRTFQAAELNHLPMPWEHGLFFGLVPLLALFLGLFRRWRDPRTGIPDPRARRFFWCLALLFFGTLLIGKLSLYEILIPLPGASAIRTVTRIALVMTFPVGVLLAWEFDTHLALISRRSVAFGCAGLAFALLVADQACRLDGIPYSELAARTAPYDHLLAADGHRHRLFAFVPDSSLTDEPTNQILDVMLATQRAGYPTLNGYSGNHPTDYPEGLQFGMFSPTRHAEAAALLLSQWTRDMPLALTRDALLLPSDLPFIAPRQAFPLLGKGFAPWDLDVENRVWAKRRQAELLIPASPENVGKRARLVFDLSALEPGPITIQTGKLLKTVTIPAPPQRIPVDIEFPIESTLGTVTFSATQHPQTLNQKLKRAVFSLDGVRLQLIP